MPPVAKNGASSSGSCGLRSQLGERAGIADSYREAVSFNFLFRLVSARHRRAPIVVATNIGFRAWQNIFPSEAQAMATLDRLLDNASILPFNGKTWREPRDGSLEEASD